MRLDDLINRYTGAGRRQARQMILAGRVQVDGAPWRDVSRIIDGFTAVALDGRRLHGRRARYLMLHKPRGCLSATVDPRHPTVLELLPEGERDGLHIAGRLDFNTTGLLLLTNDGRWSRRLTLPEEKLPKTYRVQTALPIAPETEAVFGAGMYFRRENLTLQPAQLERLGEREARLTIYEGRYHQVKRMFGYLQNKVVALHRESMGAIALDPALAPGQHRPLTAEEIASLRASG